MTGSLAWLREPSDLTALVAQDRAVLFLYVNWSGYATAGLRMMERAAGNWANDYAQCPVSWWAVDFSLSPPPLAAVADWLATQRPMVELSASELIDRGAGPAVWIEKGKVVGFTRAVSPSGVEGLMQRTREVFRVEQK